MKKILLFTLLISQLFIACDKDKANAFVEVSIKESSSLQSGVSVFMFSDRKGPNTSLFKPIFSDKTVITEANGVATFNLQETFDLDVLDSQTTLYFGVFGANDQVKGSSAVTIEKGQTKSIVLEY